MDGDVIFGDNEIGIKLRKACKPVARSVVNQFRCPRLQEDMESEYYIILLSDKIHDDWPVEKMIGYTKSYLIKLIQRGAYKYTYSKAYIPFDEKAHTNIQREPPIDTLVVEHMTCGQALAVVDRRTRAVLRRLFLCQETEEAIAKRFKMSRSWVNYIKHRGLAEIRKGLDVKD